MRGKDETCNDCGHSVKTDGGYSVSMVRRLLYLFGKQLRSFLLNSDAVKVSLLYIVINGQIAVKLLFAFNFCLRIRIVYPCEE